MLPTALHVYVQWELLGIWKLIMLSWSYERIIQIPCTIQKRKFTGGLSRLIQKQVFSKNLCKNDFNSLYPSITLTWNIKSPQDIDNIILLYQAPLTERV